MPFDKSSEAFELLLTSLTYHQFSYLKRCHDGLKELGLTWFNREILGEGTPV